MKKIKEVKAMTYYGERTAKDAPVFLLARTFGVWGNPPPQPILKSDDTRQSGQGDLFGASGS